MVTKEQAIKYIKAMIDEVKIRADYNYSDIKSDTADLINSIELQLLGIDDGDKFARALLNGYTVEPEPKYYVFVPKSWQGSEHSDNRSVFYKGGDDAVRMYYRQEKAPRRTIYRGRN